MKVDYLFSRRDKWGSKLICWASRKEVGDMNHCPSHVAVLMNDKLVVESVFGKGVRIIPYNKWLELNEELYKIPCIQGYRSSKEITDELFHIWGKPYDWRGIMFFAWSFIRFMVFDKPMPKQNKWQRDSHFFCTEYAGRISGTDYSMTTPAKMLKTFLES